MEKIGKEPRVQDNRNIGIDNSIGNKVDYIGDIILKSCILR